MNAPSQFSSNLIGIDSKYHVKEEIYRNKHCDIITEISFQPVSAEHFNINKGKKFKQSHWNYPYSKATHHYCLQQCAKVQNK